MTPLQRLRSTTLGYIGPSTVAVGSDAVSPKPAAWSYFNAPNIGSSEFRADTMLLLTDGSVLIHNGEDPSPRAEWYRLTPDMSQADPNQRYARGTWSGPTRMLNTRQFFSSAVLRDGRVYVIGGEYSDSGNDSPLGEIFDPITNTWTALNKPADFSWVAGDASGCVLADGRVLLAALDQPRTALWNPANNTWTESGRAFGTRPRSSKTGDCNEETWTLLPDGTVLAMETTNSPQGTEIYDPTTDLWTPVASVPPNLALLAVTDDSTTPPTVSSPNELGPAVLLHSGVVFAVGGTGHTALYDPVTGWTAGPDFGPNTAPKPITPLMTAIDAPGSVLPSNKVFCVVGNTRNEGGDDPFWSGPTVFYEYDPTLNKLSALPADLQPTTNEGDTWMARLLLLPTGQLLFSSGQRTIALFTPAASDPPPNPAWRPTLTGYAATMVAGKSYPISGIQMNGLTPANSYGDDAQMATNFPIVQVTNRAIHTSVYLRTHDFSSLGIAPGNTSTAIVDLPAHLTPGAYDLIVIANGIPSAAVSVTITALT